MDLEALLKKIHDSWDKMESHDETFILGSSPYCAVATAILNHRLPDCEAFPSEAHQGTRSIRLVWNRPDID